MRCLRFALPLLALASCSNPPQGGTPYTPSPGMEAVLKERQLMHAKDVSDAAPDEARLTPTLVEASNALSNVRGLPAENTEVPQVTDLLAIGKDGALPARLYRPAVAENTPIILYFVGGTWTTGTLDGFDESARQLAARTGFIVLSLRTRLAPEVRFPAEHDDAFAFYEWARDHMREWGADPTRVTLAGEGPGGNLAISTALLARDRAQAGSPTPVPDHLLLINPVAGTELGTKSMRENSDSEPLSRDDVDSTQWAYARRHLRDPRIDIVARNDLAGLPPTTVILSPIDPLRSGGEDLAAKLIAAGVPTRAEVFPGTTYGFFGLGIRVTEAASAEDFAASQLKAAFPRRASPPMRRRAS